MSAQINIGFGTTIRFEDTSTIKIGAQQTSNCDWVVRADATFNLNKVMLSGLSIPSCDKARPIVSSDSLLFALGDLQAQISCCCAQGVLTVTDDGNGVVVVDNTDPRNPVVGFNGIYVDGVTIAGNGTAAHPLVAVGGGGGGIITAIADTNTIDLDVGGGTLTANLKYIDSSEIEFSDSVAGFTGLLKTTTVVAGAYGNATTIPTFTVDSKGRLTLATNVPISFPTVSRPLSEIFVGTGASYTSSPNATYDVATGVFTILDATSGLQGIEFVPQVGFQVGVYNVVSQIQNVMQSSGGVLGLTVTDFSTGISTGFQLDTSTIQFTVTNATYNNVLLMVQDAIKIQPHNSLDCTLRWYERANPGGTNYVGFRNPATIATDVTWILPNTDSTGTQALVSDGAGNLSWSSVAPSTTSSDYTNMFLLMGA